jgi:Spy/CpxP family protein refolding chaperone
MKKQILTIAGCIFLFMMLTDAVAQRGRSPIRQQGPARAMTSVGEKSGQLGVCMAIEDLTPEQTEKIRALHLSRMEASALHRANMDELQAKKRGLMLAQNPDIAEVDRLIDEMSSLRAQWMKDNAAHRQEVRNMLSDEQRIIFDTKSAGRPVMRGMNRPGQGGCYRTGRLPNSSRPRSR